ncbi:polymeric immunoglobulin receptor-like isoform X1 [Sebastes umbrosus]|uniref:polymeric immunoglobulin receptor-like isoform X1 n=1 Tax=Sebastes umbrosus TaxID=72105 RepID=UPI00189D8207|nr:polymeric immunoglobulin receptor-like isoform X1 [Sebastes umbrosus]
MRMWSLQNLLFTLCIVLSCVRSAAGLIHVSGYEGGQVKVSCPYWEGYESYEKYLCKNDCGDDDVLITTTQANKNKYSIHDDKQKRIFTATISDLSRRDAGKYWCGVTRNGKDIYTEVKLEVGQDSCCDGSTKVQSHEESSVSISCQYEPKHQNDLKYICRGNHPPTCLEKALITSDNTQNGQFRLTDEKMLRKFTVTITSLTQDNSGPYLCGVHGNTGLDVFSAFELEVKEWCCVKSNKQSGIVGRPVTLQCPYPSQHRHNRKFLCKGDYRNNCTDMVTSQSRFMLQEDFSSGSFLVTIREMKAGDAGTYWCGSDSQWSTGNYTKIQLSVEWCCVKSNKQSGIVGRPVTLQCPYPPQHSHNRKFLCKGDHRNNCTDMVTSQSRFKLQDDDSSGSFLVTIREMKAGDAGTYWCGSDSQWSAGNYTKIQLSVGTVLPQQTSTVVEPVGSQSTHIPGKQIDDAAPFHPVVFIVPAVLLILTFALVMVFKYKCYKVRGAGANVNRNRTKAAQTEEVISVADIYANQDIALSKQRSSKPQSACQHYDDAGETHQDSVYQNYTTTDDIYCNQVPIKANRR